MKRALLIIIFISRVISQLANDGYKRNPMIDVLNYSFKISVNDTNDLISGNAAITISFRGSVSTLEFDLKNLGPDGKGMIVDSVILGNSNSEWLHKEDKITITTGSLFRSGTTEILKVVYHGIPADGLIISENKYGNRSFFSDNWPDRASNYIPCIDHPYDKATLDFIIIAPAHYEVVANGFLAEESHFGNNMKKTHWREEIPLATKVMSFAAAEFDYRLSGTVDNIPVWSYVFKENREEGYNDYAIAVKPVRFFSELIGPYPFEKLANVQSKTIFGGLENASCIFYSENSVTGKGRTEGLIAHEVAHQWFGNSVTESDWHHIWLSEGFATYLTSVYMEKNYGREQLAIEMKTDREQVIKYYLKSQRPVVDSTITNLMRLLSINSYQKGAWILHMLRHRLGDEIFWKGMRIYYERFRGKNVLTSDFEDVMEEVSGKDLNGFFNQWLYASGQPDLKIAHTPLQRRGITEITIEQKQDFLFSFPLELLIYSQNGTIRKIIDVSDRITKFKVKTGQLIRILPDPDTNLLFRQVLD